MRFLEENRRTVAVLLVMLAIIGILSFYKHYEQAGKDPDFCASCHIMKEAYKTLHLSKHRDFACQSCHVISLWEQDRMLITFVIKGLGSTGQKHGRISPWDACAECHMSGKIQGAANLSASYGHIKHVSVQKINCSRCHTSDLHKFSPDEQACSGCHKDKIIHGMGMEGFSCLKCHSYSEKAPKMISTERCVLCHKGLSIGKTMSSLKCFDCHHPHGKLKPTSQDCLKTCHINETNVGQHNLHMTKAKLQCLDCHKAHNWSVGKKEAATLCSRCHRLKDPASFVR